MEPSSSRRDRPHPAANPRPNDLETPEAPDSRCLFNQQSQIANPKWQIGNRKSEISSLPSRASIEAWCGDHFGCMAPAVQSLLGASGRRSYKETRAHPVRHPAHGPTGTLLPSENLSRPAGASHKLQAPGKPPVATTHGPTLSIPDRKSETVTVQAGEEQPQPRTGRQRIAHGVSRG